MEYEPGTRVQVEISEKEDLIEGKRWSFIGVVEGPCCYPDMTERWYVVRAENRLLGTHEVKEDWIKGTLAEV